jgi:hypothetical protein
MHITDHVASQIAKSGCSCGLIMVVCVTDGLVAVIVLMYT